MRFQISEKETFGENRPLNMALKALLRACVRIPSSVNGNLNGTAKRNIFTRKWSTGAQMVEC